MKWEIEFRGKTAKGEWVYGDLLNLHNGDKYIVNNKFGACIDNNGNFINTESPFVFKVIPETVGQFTGYTDKSGKRIFEGDIVCTERYEMYEEKLYGYYGYDNDGYPQKIPNYKGYMTVKLCRHNDNYLAVVERRDDGSFWLTGTSTFVGGINNKVIGNIFEKESDDGD